MRGSKPTIIKQDGYLSMVLKRRNPFLSLLNYLKHDILTLKHPFNNKIQASERNELNDDVRFASKYLLRHYKKYTRETNYVRCV